MKTLLIASSLIAVTVTSARAEVAFTPSASIGVKSTDSGKTWNADAAVALGVAASTTTDDGLELGAEFNIESGNLANADGKGSTGATLNPYVYVRGSFGEIYAKENDDDEAVFGLTGKFNATSYVLEHNWDTDVAKFGLTQEFGQFSLGAEVNTAEQWNLKAAYDNGQFNGSVKIDQADVVTVTAGIKQDGFMMATEYNTLDEWKVSTEYGFGLHSIKAAYESDKDYLIEGAYGINEKLSIYASSKVEDQKDQEVGMGLRLTF